MSVPIVFVHGAFNGGWAFDGFRRPFEDAGYATHAPTLPHHSHGADLERLAATGVREYADFIAATAKALPQPPILIGHSLGGLIVQLAAVRTPVAGLVLIGPSAPWGVTPTTLDEHANAFGVSMLGDYWRRPIPPDYPVARRNTLDRLPRDEARRLFDQFVPESGRAVMETMHWWADASMSAAAPPYKIEAPILAIAGGRDRVNPASTVRRIINRFPRGQADFHEFPQMSHWLIGEPEWPQVAQTALDWLFVRGFKPDGAEAPPLKPRALGLKG